MRRQLLAVVALAMSGCSGGNAAGAPASVEAEAPPSGGRGEPWLIDWGLWVVSPDGRKVAAAPAHDVLGGWVLDTATKTFTPLGDVRLVRADRIVTFDPARGAYVDYETASEFVVPPGDLPFPRYENVAASNGRVLARLGRESDGHPARLLVWHQQSAVSWDRTVAAGYQDAGLAVSPDGTRIAVAEETPEERVDVTLFDAVNGQELWKAKLGLKGTLPSAQVGLPLQFSEDGSVVLVGGSVEVPGPSPDYRWIELDAARGAPKRETAVEMLGAGSKKQFCAAGISGGLLWSAKITRFSESHANPSVEWSCEYRRFVLGRTKQAFTPEPDAKLQRQVMGTDDMRCPTRAIRVTPSGLTVVRVAGSKVRVLTWRTPP